MPSTITYRYAVNEIKSVFQQAFPDAQITSNTMLFWIRTVENIIRQRHLKTEMTGAYLSEFYGPNAVPVVNDGIKWWIALPSVIYDLMNEQGVHYISYNIPTISWAKQTRFQQTNEDKVPRLYYQPYEVPSPSNPYFYRVGNIIYLLGVEGTSIVDVNIAIYGSLDPRPDYVNLDTNLGINDEQYPDLRNQLLQIGRFAMLVPRERIEAGTDERNENIQTFAKSTKPEPDQQQ